MWNVSMNKTIIYHADSASSVCMMLSTKDLRQPPFFRFSQNRLRKETSHGFVFFMFVFVIWSKCLPNVFDFG